MADFQAYVEEAKEYFSDLDDQEKYAWIAEGVGLILVLVGVVMLFL